MARTSVFSFFPLEVMMIILRYMPDLPSIYKLICVSQRANAAFEIDPVTVLDNAIKQKQPIPDFKLFARTVAILGSFISTSSSSSSTQATWDMLVDELKSLPEDPLTKGSGSYAFAAGTVGPRYLVLTAYRIETLQHICFITLLQNAHEVMWPSKARNGKKRIDIYYPIKQLRDGVSFQEAAWWPPSWVEKIRIVRALWKLVIYWNIRKICPGIKDLENMNPSNFAVYNEICWDINQKLGPNIDSGLLRGYYCHEAEEMKCVMAAIQGFMGYEDESFFVAFTPFTATATSQSHPKIEAKTPSQFPAAFKETSHWILEDPKPINGRKGDYFGQSKKFASKSNSDFKLYYWKYWFRHCNFHFPDYLGLCIWDFKRLAYLGLAVMSKKYIDPRLVPPRKSTGFNFTSDEMKYRWRDVFLWELTTLPGGGLRTIPENARMQLFRLRKYVDTTTDTNSLDDSRSRSKKLAEV